MQTNPPTQDRQAIRPHGASMDLTAVPEPLRLLAQWVPWRYDPDDDGELTRKVPYQTNGYPAKANDPSTWTTFETAAQHIGEYVGVGFVFSPDDTYVGIDLDGCRDPDTGEIAPWAQYWIDRFGSYTEISPSGTGVKIWVKGVNTRPGHKGRNQKLPICERFPLVAPGKNPGAELYDRGRYYAMTGRRLDTVSTNIEPRQDVIDEFIAFQDKVREEIKAAKRAEREASKPAAQATTLPSVNGHNGYDEHAALLGHCRAYVAKIPPAISGDKGHDATFATACCIAWGFDLPTDDGKQIFREWCATCEPPWEDHEIDHKWDDAGNEVGEKPRGHHRDPNGYAPKPGVTGQKTAKAGANGKTSAKSLDPATEAQTIVEAEKLDGVSRLRFWRGTCWRWDAGRYVELSNAEARAAVVLNLNRGFSNVTSRVTGDVFEQLKAQTILSSRVEAPTWLEPRSTDPASLDLLAARNGLIELPALVSGSRGYHHPATPRYFTTTATNYDFCIDAMRPAKWLAFLDQLWPNDQQSIESLQEWFGYFLTPDTRQQKMLLLIGPKRCGKGTIARVVRQIVGADNVAGPTLSSLSTNFGLWPLIGKTLAIISDARLSGRTDQAIVTERLLSISGEDALTIDRKNLQPVTAKLSSRIMILSNELPRLSDSSGALAGRMQILRLTESFYGREDHALTDTLLNELPGILLWAIEGWRRLRERGYFSQPESGSDLFDELSELSSPVGAFVRERCRVGAPYCVPVADIFAEWLRWCERNGRDSHGTQQTFGRDLLAAVPSIRKTQPRDGATRYRAYEGIDLIV